MPPIYTIQPTMTGGEISPGLQGRVDLAKYATGLNKCLNGIIHPQGGVSNRPGFKYVGTAAFQGGAVPGGRARLVEFVFSEAQSYIIEFNHLLARFFFDSGQIAAEDVSVWAPSTFYNVGDYVDATAAGDPDGPFYCLTPHLSNATSFAADKALSYWGNLSAYQIVLPYSALHIPKLKFAQSADTLYITHPLYPPATLTRYGHADWRYDDIEFVNGPFMPSNAAAGTTISTNGINVGLGITITSALAIFTTDHIGSLFEISHDLPSVTHSGSFTGNASSATTIGMGGWRLITHGTWTGKITVEKSLNGGSSWIEVRAFTSSDDFNPNTFGVDDNDGSAALYRLTMSGFVSGSCNYDFTIDASTVRGMVRIIAYTSPTVVTATVLRQLGSTAFTSNWAFGSFGPGRWPAVVAFSQDRLCFANTSEEPQTIWMSKTGDYTNYGTSDPLADDDSISISLPSRRLNAIESMIQLNELLVLTRSGEWSVGAGEDGVVTPTTVRSKSHGFRGSNGIDPVIVGNRAIYVQSQGTVVRDLGFDFSSDGFAGDDLSLISSHLFKGHEIIDLVYQQEPDSLIYALRDDGVLLCGTYVREQQVLAWSQHTTQGGFLSIATIPGDGYDQLWAITGPQDTQRIQVQMPRMVSTEPEDQFFVDGGITYDGTPVDTLIDLFALINQTVVVLADGVYVGTQFVDGSLLSGITLPKAASIIHVGVPYTFDVETLRLEVGERSGTLQGRKSRVSHVNARFLQTRGGLMGPDENHLYDIDQELKKLVTIEDPKALATGDVRHTIASDWDNGGRVFFRQDKPLPVTILAFMPVLTVGG